LTKVQDKNAKGWRSRTRQVHSGSARSGFGETSEAIYLTSGFCYENAEQAAARFAGEDDGYIYSRFSNPTVQMFQDRIAALEEAEDACATASGMAAVAASMLCQLTSGDHVVGARALFGSCRYILDEILPRFGIEVSLVDGTDLDQWQNAVRPNTVCAFLETPTNPMLEMIDIAAVSNICHSVSARLIIDNVFATPILQKPLELGADIVVYSATKHIDGQGRCLGGAVLGDTAFCEEILRPYLRHTGPSMSPFNAWVLLKGLETLDLRVHQHCLNAQDIVGYLYTLDGITNVIYPSTHRDADSEFLKQQMHGGGSVITFHIDGDQERAFRFLNGLNLVKISNNLGDAKSLITHPLTTTHQRLGIDECDRLGIKENTMRLSVGLEDPEDIKEDIVMALKSA